MQCCLCQAGLTVPAVFIEPGIVKVAQIQNRRLTYPIADAPEKLKRGNAALGNSYFNKRLIDYATSETTLHAWVGVEDGRERGEEREVGGEMMMNGTSALHNTHKQRYLFEGIADPVVHPDDLAGDEGQALSEEEVSRKYADERKVLLATQAHDCERSLNTPSEILILRILHPTDLMCML